MSPSGATTPTTSFYSNDNRRTYLETLAEYAERYELKLLGFCLVTKHLHLVAVPRREDSLAQALGHTHQLHAQSFNRRYRRSGHVRKSRLCSCPLGPWRTAAALTYGDLNPVRAGLRKLAVVERAGAPESLDESGLLDLEDAVVGAISPTGERFWRAADSARKRTS